MQKGYYDLYGSQGKLCTKVLKPMLRIEHRHITFLYKVKIFLNVYTS